jgi:hypothetical protein
MAQDRGRRQAGRPARARFRKGMRAPIQLRIDADDGVIAPREMPWVHWHGRESGVAPLSPLSRPERQKNNRPGGCAQGRRMKPRRS